MRTATRSTTFLGIATTIGLLGLAPMAEAVHFHTLCPAASGSTGDTALPGGAQVSVGNDVFLDAATNTPVTIISVGQTVTWTWAPSSPYCHSVTGTGWGTVGDAVGRIRPANAEPSLPLLVVSGNEFWPDPTNAPGDPLSFTHAFPAPGTFPYQCNEHSLSGMRGVVVVM